MRLLLDTNILLWATSGTHLLDQQTLRLVDDPANTVLFSAVSIWEIAIKAGLKRPDFDVAPEGVLADAIEAGFQELPLRSSVATTAVHLPMHHGDPFDRLIIAQAMAEPAVLLTTDRIMSRYTELASVVGRPS